MTKIQADELILAYQKKIYGFALSKQNQLSDAEELAAEIICQVYLSLLAQDFIPNNIDGYIWRISCNTYSHFIKHKKQNTYVDLWDTTICYEEADLKRMEQEETLHELRKGIGLLSKQQRIILYLYYYNNKPIKEIAAQLGISSGTVKWHLSAARLSLKEEFIMNESITNLSINPIHFCDAGHNGSPGSKGDTYDIFDTLLKQNIAYCCYNTEHTAEEIARILEIPLSYVLDELKILVEYGYLDPTSRTKSPKYRTNMVITDLRENIKNNTSKIALYKDAAKQFCDDFYPSVFYDFESSKDLWGFQCYENDINYMKYNLVMLITNSLILNSQPDWNTFFEQYAVKRPDGGHFIAHACITDDCQPPASDSDIMPYHVCGYMNRTVYKNSKKVLDSIQINCFFDSRSGGWRDNLDSDWENMYSFIKHTDPLTPESYTRLCYKGYILDKQPSVMYLMAQDQESIGNILGKYIFLPKNICNYAKEFDTKLYELEKKQFPKHIQPIIQFYHKNCLNGGDFIPYLIEEMLERNILKPLTEQQKKSVFSVMIFY